jgi:hypothetical protein
MIRVVGQVIAYGAFVAVLGVLSVWPDYRLLDEQEAIVSLTFSHAAERVGECRRLTQAELNELPPNMRRPNDCPRERHPVRVEMRLNDSLVFSKTLPASGLWKDGKANVYRRTTIEAGHYSLFIGMNDSGSSDGYDFERRQFVTIAPGQNLVVSFDDLQKAFVIE